MLCAQLLNRVWLFATTWTVAHQAPLSMGILQARILEWVAILSSRGIYPTQGLNPGLPCCRRILNHLSHQGIIHLLISSLHFFHQKPGSCLKQPARFRKWPRETAASPLQGLGQTAWLFLIQPLFILKSFRKKLRTHGTGVQYKLNSDLKLH